MQTHDEERLVYGAVYVQGKKYFLLEPRPTRRDLWMVDGTYKWLVTDSESLTTERNSGAEFGEQDGFIYYYLPSHIVIGSDAIIDLLPVPLTKKVIRFYVTDDEEA